MNKIKLLLIAIVVLITAIVGGYEYFSSKLNEANTDLAGQIKLNNTLQDSLEYTTNKYNEVVATKLTLQANFKELKKHNNELTNYQKELVNRIINLKDKNDVISAALVETQIKIDSLKSVDVDSTIVNDSSVTFIENNDTIQFDLTVDNVTPINTPELSVNSLMITNKQFITFQFEDKGKYNQTPVSFSISNSNPLISTTNADSHIIPEINKKALNLSFWVKVNKFINRPVFKYIGGIVIFSSGVYIGSKF